MEDASPSMAPAPRKWLRAISSPSDPAVAKARRCLVELEQRSFQMNGLPVRACVEVLDSDFPWAGVIGEPPHRARSSMFVTKGLVNRLSHEELIAVMGHEWGHVADKRQAAEWALRGAALSATLGLHALTLSVALGAPGMSGTGWASLLIVAITLGLMGACLTWERKARHWQELACDRFAARLVGARTMVSTLRRVDALMKKTHAAPVRRPRSLLTLTGSSHPSVNERVLNIVRHRRRLRGSP